ncbi:MAG: alpha/beta hydrolase fold domain-containing protein, partial [Chloroflexales bacterium]|nr:alpha/beta hydrolase fold domain-containing protein [Chloroflexales bacterium]
MQPSDQPAVIALWPNGAPGSEDWTHEEQESPNVPPFDITVVRNVARPTLTAFLPAPGAATGAAAIVCPGGAFHFLAIDHEGYDVARWLNARGVAAFVLRYRLIPTPVPDDEFWREFDVAMANDERMRVLMEQYGPLIMADGLQAVRVVRQRAAGWGVDQGRVGIMGFSAGGWVTVAAATQYDAASRPAFAAPIYAPPWGDIAVPADAPPVFIAVAHDDEFATTGSIPLYRAWQTARR